VSAQQPGTCPRCGTPFAPGQEYCLECGLRLPGRTGLFSGVAASWARRGWYPGDWVWPVLVFLILAGLGALAAIVLSSGSSADTINAVPSSSGSTPGVTQPSTPAPTVPTVTQAPPTTTAAPPTPPRPPGALTAWPTRDGYTVILQSIPAGAGRTNAVRTAKQALSAGLPQVGVLDSAQYSSLHPGYYVVFTGIYATNGEASAHVSDARSAGFGAAYVRPITH
jgi:cell division septation protein DedD